MEPLLPDPTPLPLTCLSLVLLGPRLSARWEMHCALDHALDDRSCRTQDVFHSSPLSGDNHENCSAAGSSCTREKWMLILPTWFLLSCLSWSARPSCPFFEQCSSLKRRPSSHCGGWIVAGKEAALGSSLATASQSDGDAHSCGRHQRGEGPYGLPYFFCPSQQHA